MPWTVPDTEGIWGDMVPEVDRDGEEVEEFDRVGDPGGSRPALKLPRLPALPKLVGVLGSLSIGTAGAKALLCRDMLEINDMVMILFYSLTSSS